VNDAIDGLGMAATGGIIAREVEGTHAHGTGKAKGKDGHDPSDACANCGAALTSAFCADCGQHGHVHRTIGALGHDILHGVFHFEGKTWNTLPLLATQPGELTRRYAQGERAKFMSPMALFLFSVFLMFAVAASLAENWSFGGGLERSDPREALIGEYQYQADRLARADKRLARPVDAEESDDVTDRADATARRNKAGAELARIAAAAKALNVELAKETKAKAAEAKSGSSFEKSVKHVKDNPGLFAYKVKTYAYKYSWALIPISVPFIWLLFPLRRDVGLYDHAIFATYSLSFMLLFATLLAALFYAGVPQWMLWTAFGLVPPVHMYRQLKGAYQLSRAGALWRLALLLTFTTITSSLFFALLMYLGGAE
jgi:hypothetical protein